MELQSNNKRNIWQNSFNSLLIRSKNEYVINADHLGTDL